VNDPLQGLWVFGEHWALETIHITTHTENNVTNADLVGQVTVDGVLFNEKLGYEEAFGLQTIAGFPFYFFKRGGKSAIPTTEWKPCLNSIPSCITAAAAPELSTPSPPPTM